MKRKCLIQACALAVWAATWGIDSSSQTATEEAQRFAELARMVAAHPALAAAPAPAFVRMHQISVGETAFDQDPYPSAHSVASARVLILGTQGPIIHSRMELLSSSIQTTLAGTPSAKFTETDRKSDSTAFATLGGLLGLESRGVIVDRRPGGLNMTISSRVESINSVEGSLFPLATGNRLKVRFTNLVSSAMQGRAAGAPVTWDVENEYIVVERRDAYEADGLRIDGGVFKIEAVSRHNGRGNSALAMETRTTQYYSEKYGSTVGSDNNSQTSTSTGSGRNRPVLLIAADAAAALSAELERYDRELSAVHKATAESYLAPRRAAVMALASGSTSRPAQNAGCLTAGDSVWRALLSAGFKQIAERSSNLYMRTGAAVAGQVMGSC